MAGTALSFVNLSRQVTNNLNDINNSSDVNVYGDALGIHVRFQINATKHLRPYLGIISKETGYGSALLPNNEMNRLYINYTAIYGFLGVDYVFKPVNNMMLSRVEWSAGGGLSYASLSYEHSTRSLDYPLEYVTENRSAIGSGNLCPAPD